MAMSSGLVTARPCAQRFVPFRCMQPASPFGWTSRPVGGGGLAVAGSEPPAGDAIRPSDGQQRQDQRYQPTTGDAGAGGSRGNLPATLRPLVKCDGHY